MTWLPTHTAPFGKVVQYAINVDGHLIRCVGTRVERADFDDERPQHIGVIGSERHSGNYWTEGDEDAEEPSEHRESDVHGWLPLGEAGVERVAMNTALLWRFVSRDALGNIEFERLFAGNGDEARTYYLDAEARARRDGGHVELLCNGKRVAAYRGVSDTD